MMMLVKIFGFGIRLPLKERDMEGKLYYKVRYSVTTSLEGHGEFSQNQNVLIQSFKSETNDLNEIFTDLFGLHRHEGLLGLEILSVESYPIENLLENPLYLNHQVRTK